MSTLDEVIWMNGVVYPAADAKISVLDRGFLYGDSVYETMRVYRGTPFGLQDHLLRLQRSAALIGFELAYDLRGLEDAVRETLAASHLREALMRIVCTRGRSAQGYWTQTLSESQLLVMHLRLPDLPDSLYTVGRSACLVADRWGPGDPRAKTGNRMRGILATVDAQAAGADEAILLNDAGEITEAASANVFALVRGQWCTPPEDAEILPGITRRTVLEEAAVAQIDVREAPLLPGDLAAASTVFLCSSVRELLPIVRLDGAAVGSGTVSEDFLRMRRLYHGAVLRQCGS